jgi:DNA-binding NarL/FixJ family response regulator
MRMLIAGRESKVRFAVRVALERQSGFRTISEASDAEDMLAQVRTLRPDIAIIDFDLPGMPVLELIGVSHQICRELRVIVLSTHPEIRQQTLAAGASAFVSMCNTPDDLLAAIDHCVNPDALQE